MRPFFNEFYGKRVDIFTLACKYDSVALTHQKRETELLFHGSYKLADAGGSIKEVMASINSLMPILNIADPCSTG